MTLKTTSQRMAACRNVSFLLLLHIILCLQAGAQQITGLTSDIVVDKPTNDGDFPVVSQNRLGVPLCANSWADHVEYCFQRDAELSKDYNLNIAGGKRNHMMDQTHIGYASWDEPRQGNTLPKVTRVKPEDAKQGEYLFREMNGVVVMEAEHFFESKTNGKTTWAVIPDLGRTLSGLALMPYIEKTDGASLTNRMTLDSKSDSVRLRMFFDSTLPFKKGGHRVTASFDGGNEQTWNINDQLTWKNNYAKMYPAGAARMIETVTTFGLPRKTDSMHVLTIRPLDPGVVFYKVIVNDGGYEKTYLKMPESPYKRQ